jgi:hypothetical protein
LCVCACRLRKALGANAERVEWIVDKTTGAFYGSAFVWMTSVGHGKGLVERSRGAKGIHISPPSGRARRIRVNFVPAEGFKPLNEREFPPFGTATA